MSFVLWLWGLKFGAGVQTANLGNYFGHEVRFVVPGKNLPGPNPSPISLAAHACQAFHPNAEAGSSECLIRLDRLSR